MRMAAQLMLVLVVLSLPVQAESLAFRNFSSQIHLLPQGDRFQVAETGEPVAVAERLLVKVSGALSRDDLARLYPAVSAVTTLFAARDFTYFSVELTPGSGLAPALAVFSAQAGVMLVQPDILQLVRRTGAPARQPVADLPLPAAVASLSQQNRGRGVRVAVIDDGFDLSHPALSRVKVAFSYDVASRALAAAPQPGDTHGTRVAGVLFADPSLKGLQGLVPEAEFIAIRQPDSWTSNTLLAFQLAALEKADVINCSWNTQLLLQPVADAVQELAAHGRNGKGVAVVFAAGNEGRAIAAGSSESAIPEAIVVAATDAQGQRLGNSNFGASVDVSAYGGVIRSTAPRGRYAPFAGTSLASAIVSGTAALLLASRPEADLASLLEQLHTVLPTQAPATGDRLNAGL